MNAEIVIKSLLGLLALNACAVWVILMAGFVKLLGLRLGGMRKAAVPARSHEHPPLFNRAQPEL